MRTSTRKITCVAIAAGLCGIAHATGAWNPVSDAQLAETRGGFDAGSGLQMSFGIEREGYINGKLVSATRLHVAGITDITRQPEGQANAIATAVLRNGSFSNALHPAQPEAAVVIQNTLNRQDIRSLTVINATANSLQLIKGLNLQSTLTDALALGNR